MSKYSRQHYRDIASLLRKGKASAYEINKWCKKFKRDNPRFSAKLFKDWINKGK
jgi:hypothetical protein